MGMPMNAREQEAVDHAVQKLINAVMKYEHAKEYETNETSADPQLRALQQARLDLLEVFSQIIKKS